jgi:cobalamin biosynthesis protein CobT
MDQKSSARVYPFRMIPLEAAESRSSKNLGMLQESLEIAAKSDQHASWFAATQSTVRNSRRRILILQSEGNERVTK